MAKDFIKRELTENENYRVTINYDCCPSNPLAEMDMAWCFLFESDNKWHHQLSSECNYHSLFNDYQGHSLFDALLELLMKHCDENDIRNHFSLNTYDDVFDYCKDYIENDEMVELIEKYSKGIYVKKFALRGYSQGEYVEGVAFCEVGENSNEENKKSLDSFYKDELDILNKWMWGEVYDFSVEEKVTFVKTYKDGTTEEGYEWKEIDYSRDIYDDVDTILEDLLTAYQAIENENIENGVMDKIE